MTNIMVGIADCDPLMLRNAVDVLTKRDFASWGRTRIEKGIFRAMSVFCQSRTADFLSGTLPLYKKCFSSNQNDRLHALNFPWPPQSASGAEPTPDLRDTREHQGLDIAALPSSQTSFHAPCLSLLKQ
jgi:hypothetical protein